MSGGRWCAAALVGAALLGAPCPGRASDSGSSYGLSSPPSEFEWGCFGACLCAVQVQSPMTGTFVLRPSGSDPLFTYYDVLSVLWQAKGTDGPVTITGSGTYRRGGEVALQEELALDLSFNGGPVQHFDSGLRAPGAVFPEISTRISLHQEVCHDSVLVVVAKPVTVLDVGGTAIPLAVTATPNPFARTTQIGLKLSRAGIVTVRVFEITGRHARSLVEREWLPAGQTLRAWDGRRDDGRAAPPGLYLVRVDTPAGSLTGRVVKLE